MTRGFLLSSALHAALFALFLFTPSAPAFEWDRSDVIAVDLIATPEPPREEPPPPAPAPEPEPEPTPEPPTESPPADPVPPTPVQPKPPKPKYVIRPAAPRREPDEGPTLADRLQGLLEKTPAEPSPPAETAPPPVPSAPTAEVHASDFPYAWYLNVVRRKITDSWDPPGDRMISGRANRVLVRFRIHRDGRVTGVEVEGGSGTPGLDASTRRAIDLAKPFPPLPDTYEGESLDVAVRFTVEGGA